MRIRRPGRPDAEEAERLLRTGLGGVAVNGDLLANLLAAAAAPARPDELAGEDAALAAFRAEAGHSPPIPVRTPWRRRAGTVWIAVAAATATAGVAVAASTQSRDEPAQPRPSTVPAPTQQRTPVGTGTGAASPYSPPPSVAGSAPNVVAPSVDPQAAGLCRTYLAKDGVERGKSLRTPAFRTLVAAAGGPDKVDAYCRQVVLSSPEHGQPSAAHSQPSAEHGRDSAPGQDPATKSAGKASN